MERQRELPRVWTRKLDSVVAQTEETHREKLRIR